jgi:pyruvate/2-oxoglutarate dehydrogenase complex dihydrolipoamide dehydrogenase (E3) component
MRDNETFDAIIIGTGQGGKPLAGALAQAGWRTAIVERDRVGGTCVVAGCTPTKTMAASARVAYLARRAADFGVRTGPVSVDMEAVRRRKRAIVDDWSESSRKGLERHKTLELVRGEGRFASPQEIVVRDGGGSLRYLAADRIFINAGARPAVPPIPGLDGVPYLDSTSIMELDHAPDHLLVLGGGFIGLEFGQMFRRFGAEVTIIEAGPRIAGREDDDVADAMAAVLREDGIDVRTSTRVVRAERRGDGDVTLVVEAHGAEERISGSSLLVAVGRQPNSDTLDLDAAGLKADNRGFIPVDEYCHTAVNGIWALGDITGSPPFTHTAYDDFRVIHSQLFGEGQRSTRGRLLPYAVFTDPQLGRVGLSEQAARAQGFDIRVAKLPMTRVARAIELDETRGLMKAVVDAATGRILGAAILGIEGGEVVSALQMAMLGDLSYTTLRDAVMAHPTLAESLNNLFMTLD